jgi:hypothetical protein
MCRALRGEAGAPLPRQEPAPYQDWAKQKVQESFNRRGVDDPMARCLNGGHSAHNDGGSFPDAGRADANAGGHSLRIAAYVPCDSPERETSRRAGADLYGRLSPR